MQIKKEKRQKTGEIMRLYDFRCQSCGWVRECLVGNDEVIHCAMCGGNLDRLPPLVRVNVGPVPAGGYYDETLGTYIHTETQRKEVMREQGVTEYGATPKNGGAWV